MKLLDILTPCYCSNTKTIIDNEIEESGLDRVKRIFKKTEFGFMSPELFYLVHTAYASVVVSAILGAFIHANKEKEEYTRKNVASQYESKYLARRHLTDSMTLSAIKGGLKYGAKYGTFSSLYVLSTMTIANYNNKISIWEHIICAATLGGLSRFRFGIKGMAVAACTGGILGALGGGIFVLSVRLAGLTLQEIREAQSYAYYSVRKKRLNTSQTKEEFFVENYNRPE